MLSEIESSVYGTSETRVKRLSGMCVVHAAVYTPSISIFPNR